MSTAVAREGDLLIRRVRDDPADYELLVRWRNAPHVREFWDPDDPALTLDAAARQYRPVTRADHPTTGCIIEVTGRPVGYIQFYRWSSYPDAAAEVGMPFEEGSWGLDVFAGEPDAVGMGVGSRAVDLLCGHLFAERGATVVALAAALDNARAIGAYEKAGFHKRGKVLDTDTRGGERVWCWLMVRERPA